MVKNIAEMEKMIICQSSNYGNFHILIFPTLRTMYMFCLGEERGRQILTYVLLKVSRLKFRIGHGLC